MQLSISIRIVIVIYSISVSKGFKRGMNNIIYHNKYRSRYNNESIIILSIVTLIVMVLIMAILILSIIISVIISSCYLTVLSAIWEIFSEFLIFCNLFHEPLGE